MQKYDLPNNRVLELVPDEDAESPRKWSNAGVMVCFHSRYDLGDDHDYAEYWRDCQAWDELSGGILHDHPNALILPLYLYDHGGITMSVGKFSCPWDSGQVGFIYCTTETIAKEWGGDREKAEACLRAEVDVYDQYLQGDVWGFVIKDRCDACGSERETEDSCWGFYGDDPLTNGMVDNLSEEDRNALKEMSCTSEAK